MTRLLDALGWLLLTALCIVAWAFLCVFVICPLAAGEWLRRRFHSSQGGLLNDR
jgi:hypothetical protein